MGLFFADIVVLRGAKASPISLEDIPAAFSSFPGALDLGAFARRGKRGAVEFVEPDANEEHGVALAPLGRLIHDSMRLSRTVEVVDLDATIFVDFYALGKEAFIRMLVAFPAATVKRVALVYTALQSAHGDAVSWLNQCGDVGKYLLLGVESEKPSDAAMAETKNIHDECKVFSARRGLFELRKIVVKNADVPFLYKYCIPLDLRDDFVSREYPELITHIPFLYAKLYNRDVAFFRTFLSRVRDPLNYVKAGLMYVRNRITLTTQRLLTDRQEEIVFALFSLASKFDNEDIKVAVSIVELTGWEKFAPFVRGLRGKFVGFDGYFSKAQNLLYTVWKKPNVYGEELRAAAAHVLQDLPLQFTIDGKVVVTTEDRAMELVFSEGLKRKREATFWEEMVSGRVVENLSIDAFVTLMTQDPIINSVALTRVSKTVASKAREAAMTGGFFEACVKRTFPTVQSVMPPVRALRGGEEYRRIQGLSATEGTAMAENWLWRKTFVYLLNASTTARILTPGSMNAYSPQKNAFLKAVQEGRVVTRDTAFFENPWQFEGYVQRQSQYTGQFIVMGGSMVFESAHCGVTRSMLEAMPATLRHANENSLPDDMFYFGESQTLHASIEDGVHAGGVYDAYGDVEKGRVLLTGKIEVPLAFAIRPIVTIHWDQLPLATFIEDTDLPANSPVDFEKQVLPAAPA